VWLATAAAIGLLVAGSLAWWRTGAPDDVGVAHSTSVTVEPSPDDPVVVDTAPDDPSISEPIRWRKVASPGGFSAPIAATAFKGGVIAVSGDGIFKPMSWWAPDGRSFEIKW